MENLDIKICLVIKYTAAFEGIEFEKVYVPEKIVYIKPCLIMNDIAYDLDSDLEFPILKTNNEGEILEEIELEKYYVYQIYEYGKVYLNDKLIYEPKISYDKLYRKAYSKYLNNKNIVPYEKFLQKKKERK